MTDADIRRDELESWLKSKGLTEYQIKDVLLAFDNAMKHPHSGALKTILTQKVERVAQNEH